MKILQSWDDSLTPEETNETVVQISLLLLEEVSAGTFRDRVAGFLASNDFRSLCSLPLDYSELSSNDAIRYRQIRAFFEKRSDLDFGIDRTEAAYEKFVNSEELCSRTNQIFKLNRSGKFSFLPGVEPVLYMAQRKISEILGDLPTLEQMRLRFGPGATTSIKKKDACPRVKLGTAFACSEDLLPIVSSLLEECPGWIPFTDEDSVRVPVEVHTGRLDFVAKNWKTDRSISIEPVLNGFLQNAYGDYIAERLKIFGQDIKDQERNQRSAQLGSLTGALATIDLSSASDTVAKELVWSLLPFEWAEALSYARTSTVTHKAYGTRTLQKFSSMGNGFTFALETLIFYGLTYASCKASRCKVAEIQVYGDDIIVPVGACELLERVLLSAGFILNAEKSFSTGPFRESCGADYLSGTDIRPCYLDGSLDGNSIFVLHNFFRRSLQDELADHLLTHLSEDLKIFGPDGYGDGHLLVPFGKSIMDHLSPSQKRGSHGYGGYTFDTFTFGPRRLRLRDHPGDFALPSYSVYIRHGKSDFDMYELHPRPQVQVPSFTFDNRSRLCCPLPGKSKYRRISVYTFGG